MIALHALVLVAACAWRGPVPTPTVGDLEPSWQIVSSTKTAATRVAIRSVREGRTPDGRLVVSIDVVNGSDTALSIWIRTAFHNERSDLAASGGNTDAVWQQLRLAAQGSALYRAEAIRPGDPTWQVEIRSP
ncbi:MAG: hypothetical protein JXB39_00110 [Deltaproteobacteria bacterium]|nr:hypothetical protein [Deltaproteobacteria bacterium]